MAIHKQFQLNVGSKNGIDVQFDLEYDGQTTTVNNISIHSNFSSGLPTHPIIKFHDGKWRLCVQYNKNENGNIISVIEYLDNEYCNSILEKIIEIKENQTPKFVE